MDQNRSSSSNSSSDDNAQPNDNRVDMIDEEADPIIQDLSAFVEPPISTGEILDRLQRFQEDEFDEALDTAQQASLLSAGSIAQPGMPPNATSPAQLIQSRFNINSIQARMSSIQQADSDEEEKQGDPQPPIMFNELVQDLTDDADADTDHNSESLDYQKRYGDSKKNFKITQDQKKKHAQLKSSRVAHFIRVNDIPPEGASLDQALVNMTKEGFKQCFVIQAFQARKPVYHRSCMHEVLIGGYWVVKPLDKRIVAHFSFRSLVQSNNRLANWLSNYVSLLFKGDIHLTWDREREIMLELLLHEGLFDSTEYESVFVDSKRHDNFLVKDDAAYPIEISLEFLEQTKAFVIDATRDPRVQATLQLPTQLRVGTLLPQTIDRLTPCTVTFQSSEEADDIVQEHPLHTFRMIWKQFKMYRCHRSAFSYRGCSLVEKFMYLMNNLVGMCLYKSTYMCAQLLHLEQTENLSVNDMLTSSYSEIHIPLRSMSNTVFTDDYDFIRFTEAFDKPIYPCVAIMCLLSLVHEIQPAKVKEIQKDCSLNFVIRHQKQFTSRLEHFEMQHCRVQTIVVEVIAKHGEDNKMYSYYQVFKVVYAKGTRGLVKSLVHFVKQRKGSSFDIADAQQIVDIKTYDDMMNFVNHKDHADITSINLYFVSSERSDKKSKQLQDKLTEQDRFKRYIVQRLHDAYSSDGPVAHSNERLEWEENALTKLHYAYLGGYAHTNFTLAQFKDQRKAKQEFLRIQNQDSQSILVYQRHLNQLYFQNTWVKESLLRNKITKGLIGSIQKATTYKILTLNDYNIVINRIHMLILQRTQDIRTNNFKFFDIKKSKSKVIEKLKQEAEFKGTARIMYQNQLRLLDEVLSVVKLTASALEENFIYLRGIVDALHKRLNEEFVQNQVQYRRKNEVEVMAQVLEGLVLLKDMLLEEYNENQAHNQKLFEAKLSVADDKEFFSRISQELRADPLIAQLLLADNQPLILQQPPNASVILPSVVINQPANVRANDDIEMIDTNSYVNPNVIDPALYEELIESTQTQGFFASAGHIETDREEGPGMVVNNVAPNDQDVLEVRPDVNEEHWKALSQNTQQNDDRQKELWLQPKIKRKKVNRPPENPPTSTQFMQQQRNVVPVNANPNIQNATIPINAGINQLTMLVGDRQDNGENLEPQPNQYNLVRIVNADSYVFNPIFREADLYYDLKTRKVYQIVNSHSNLRTEGTRVVFRDVTHAASEMENRKGDMVRYLDAIVTSQSSKDQLIRDQWSQIRSYLRDSSNPRPPPGKELTLVAMMRFVSYERGAQTGKQMQMGK